MKSIVLILLLLCTVGILVVFQAQVQPPISPLSTNTSRAPQSPQYSPVIFGFLPYWNLSLVNATTLSNLSDVAYFAIDVNADGSIKTHSTPTQREPGYHSFTTKYLLQRDHLVPPTVREHLVFKLHDAIGGMGIEEQ